MLNGSHYKPKQSQNQGYSWKQETCVVTDLNYSPEWLSFRINSGRQHVTIRGVHN